MPGGTCTSMSIMLLCKWSGGMSACTAYLHNPAPCLLPHTLDIFPACLISDNLPEGE